MTTALCITGAMIAAVLALPAWGVCRAAGANGDRAMTPITTLTIIAAAAAGLLFLTALLVGLCRAAADTRPVDEGQSFGGEYHD